MPALIESQVNCLQLSQRKGGYFADLLWVVSQSLLQEQMDRDFTCQSSVIGMRRNLQYSLRYSVHANAITTVFNNHRVRKYAKFGIFYAKIVQMTSLRLRRESLRLQKFLVTNREPLRLQKFPLTNTVLSLPFCVTNTIYVNCKRCNLN